LELPGVGPYTAAAVAAIAFGRRAVVVDGNVERVMARLFAVQDPLPAAKKKLHALAGSLTPSKRCGDYAQAVMDLGATVCAPKSPACILCPWAASCVARSQGVAADLPRKAAKKPTPTRHGVAFWVVDKNDRVLLQRRPAKGLLGGMLGFPGTAWRAKPFRAAEAKAAAPVTARWAPLPGVVEHTFTHFHLKLTVWTGRVARLSGDGEIWLPQTEVEAAGLPGVMQKVARHALGKTDKKRRAV
jgi:A/G-specific adenine glycosylase